MALWDGPKGPPWNFEHASQSRKVPSFVWGECDFHVNWLHVSRIRLATEWWFWYQPATSPFNTKHTYRYEWAVGCCVPACRGRYISSMSDAHQLTDCVIINGDLAIQLSGSSKLHFIHIFWAVCIRYWYCTDGVTSTGYFRLCEDILMLVIRLTVIHLLQCKVQLINMILLITHVDRIFESVCLAVCLFVRSITQKRMIPKCSNLTQILLGMS